MEIKQIKLSPKRGGNGFVSSYSINIGTREARACLIPDGDLDLPIIKLLDPDLQQIVLRRKRYTLTPEILDCVCDHATLSQRLNRQLTRSPILPDPDTGILRPADAELLEQTRVHDEAYYSYLLSLPLEALTDLITLMCMGRDKDVDMTLPPEHRFLKYWQQLELYGSFTLGSDALASQLMYNLALTDYLRNGLAIMERNISI